MTYEQALKLATEAHKGQWRRPTEMNETYFNSHVDEIEASLTRDMSLEELEMSTGHKLSWVDSTWKISEPYVVHPIAVANLMTTEEERVVAVLHDVLKDTTALMHACTTTCKNYISFKGLTHEVSNEQFKALNALTHSPEDTHVKYIDGILNSPLAIKVKIAVIVCNLSDNPKPSSKIKYMKSLKRLLETI